MSGGNGQVCRVIRSESKLSTIVAVREMMIAIVELSRDEVHLLAWNVSNEVINGFAHERLFPEPQKFVILSGSVCGPRTIWK
jgi:hypothetical protein